MVKTCCSVKTPNTEMSFSFGAKANREIKIHVACDPIPFLIHLGIFYLALAQETGNNEKGDNVRRWQFWR